MSSELDPRGAYLLLLAQDSRFKEHVLGFFDAQKTNHLATVTSLKSSEAAIRHAQGALHIIELFENLFAVARRQRDAKVRGT